MPTPILMPALSPTMTEGNLAKWLKKEGDEVRSGDVIAEIETDKATMEVEAVDEGTMGRILVGEGTEGVAVNTPIAMLLDEGEDASALENGAAPPKLVEPERTEVPPATAKKPDADTGEKKAADEATTSFPQKVVQPPAPEVPAGTLMVKQTGREALRYAMA